MLNLFFEKKNERFGSNRTEKFNQEFMQSLFTLDLFFVCDNIKYLFKDVTHHRTYILCKCHSVTHHDVVFRV